MHQGRPLTWVHRIALATFVLATAVAWPSAAAATVDEVLAVLTGGAWTYEGPTRHGDHTLQTSHYATGPGERSFVGRGTVSVDDGPPAVSQALYVYHPGRGRWVYTAVASDGAIQEAEELEAGSDYFVFEGTSYRPDGSQTTFVWKLTLQGPDRLLSESMAYHDGAWRQNPVSEFVRETDDTERPDR